MATTTESTDSNPASARTDEFGPNEWLIEEMYVRYQADPSSVDPAWHEFFADYAPPGVPSNGAAANGAPAPAAPAPAPQAPAAQTPAAQAPAAQAPAAQAPAASPQTASVSASSPAAPAAAPAAGPAPAASGGSAHVPVIDERPATAMLPAGLPSEGPVALVADEAHDATLRGAAARVVANMESSLTIPTATSVRSVPAKVLVDNRTVINNHLRRARGGKVSFTHVIGYAVVRAAAEMPEINKSYAVVDGKPTVHEPGNVNLGLAIDLEGRDGSRSLVVAAIKVAEKMDFNQFWVSYEDIVRRARGNALTPDDFSGTTISLTNPGGIGTVHSVPRLMQGQGAIIGVGAMEYPAEFAGMSEEALTNLAVGKILTLTSTYDHRVIQGAQSGEFLRRVEELLRGEDGFYDDIFASLRIPYEPVRWFADRAFTHEGQIDKGARVIELISAYRTNGHLMADTDPLVYTVRTHPDLDITSHGLTLWDLDREFAVGGFGGKSLMKLRDILGLLRDAYCRRIGVEYMHIADAEQRSWLQERLEVAAEPLPREEQKHILGRLNVAEAFETFLQTKYVGQTRFSLEGGETVIPLLDAILQRSADFDLDEVAIGMPHRGRLNVLANIIGKPYETIFGEFEGNMDPASVQGSGDVKYHLGDEGTFTATSGKTVLVTMTANPSHLEAVDPVIEGIVRAKQDVVNRGEDGFTIMPLLMHGDAAFSGQGVVAETLNLSQLRGFRTGGTIHVIVNNQLGFTTGPAEGRSSTYCTDIARMISAPIFHVNGDDPEACVRVAKLAVEYRQKFKRDVVIDMICYRRRGHNEADNPSFTQPVMYDIIDSKRSVRKLFTEVLIGRGDITVEEAEEALRDFQQQLEKVFNETRDATGRPTPEPAMDPEPTSKPVVTAASLDTIKRIADAYATLPEGFTIHPRLKPQIDRRVAMSSSGNVDWATAELYAFGATVLDGKAVRLTGQDSRRGTFTQRHAVLIDRLDGSEYTPLRNLSADQEQFWVYDSVLSEYAVMGFEYGYSVARSDALVCWEAQYGDFADGAQTIIDEFISSGEAKWGQRSAVTLLLPHGYEGQGPDHSTGRPERFLQLAAEANMTIAMCSTPASYFHLLRRQALSEIRRPLVVFTPKSLLRHRAAVSALDDFTEGAFQPVIGDRTADPAAVKRVLICSGKVYYDLDAKRAADSRSDIAIVRVEQLYPLPVAELQEELARFPEAELVWVQEEPANQGAWQYMALNLPDWIDRRVRRASRPASASPAAGASSTSEKEQRALIEDAFA